VLSEAFLRMTLKEKQRCSRIRSWEIQDRRKLPTVD
jgi:hypothetical protein